MQAPEFPRKIRSFVLREGRLTPGQQKALDELWPRFGLESSGELDLDKVFERSAPHVLEIGFGNGESLAQMAEADPDRDYIGVEVHRPGVGHLLRQIESRNLTNLRVICHDGVEVLEKWIPERSLDRVQIFFSDPWPKKKHHKRRLIQPEFVSKLAGRMKPDAILHLATDWQNYAEQMLEVLEASSEFVNSVAEGEYAPRPDYRPLTKFETRGQRLGHGVWDLIYQCI